MASLAQIPLERLIGYATALPLVAALACNAIGFDLAALMPVYGAIFVLFLCGRLARRIQGVRIGAALSLFALFFLIAANTALSSACLARIAAPLADAQLETLDTRLFGFHWTAVLAPMQRHLVLQTLLSYVYVSLNWQPLLLIALLATLGRIKEARRFMTGWGFALLLTLALFPFAPALGAFAHFHITPDMLPAVRATAAWRSQPIMLGLRDGSITMLDDSALEGIVTMPSFHATSAILLGAGYWRIRPLRWGFAALNLLMLVSAIAIGGHYLVDVLTGSTIAIVALCVARRWGGAPLASAPAAQAATASGPWGMDVA